MSFATMRLLTSRVVANSRQVAIRSISATNQSLPRLISTIPASRSLLSRTTTPFSLNLVNSLSSQASNSEIKQKIDQLVKNKSVVLFIKGTADQPRCGFSKAVVDIMNLHGVSFESHNVLEDEALRSGIKEYSNWPTIPQIFFKGEFIGGCDILLEMHRSGELVDELKKIGIKSKLEDEEDEDEGKNKKK